MGVLICFPEKLSIEYSELLYSQTHPAHLTITQFPLLLISYLSVVHLLQLMNRYWYINVLTKIHSLHQGPLFGLYILYCLLLFLLLVLPDVSRHVSSMTLQGGAEAPGLHLFTLPLLTSGNHCSFSCLSSFAFSKMSYFWNQTVRSLFRLVSFI